MITAKYTPSAWIVSVHNPHFAQRDFRLTEKQFVELLGMERVTIEI